MQNTRGDKLVGSWELVEITHVFEEGDVQKSFALGDGYLILEASGRFCQCLVRSDLPHVASGNRNRISDAESDAILRGSLTFFGTWGVSGSDLTFQIARSSFPNWNGTQQTRVVTELTDDRLTITAPRSTLGVNGYQRWTRSI